MINTNGDLNKHIEKRKNIFLKGVSEINKLGFESKEVPTKIKKLLYESLARSKMVYGLETIIMTPKELKENVIKMESNVLK